MQRWSLGVVVLGYTLVGAALVAAQQPLPIPGATVSAGQQYFVRYCSACHGVAGHGDGPSAPALRTPPADLTRIAQRRAGHFPVAEIAALLTGGPLSRPMAVGRCRSGASALGRWPGVARSVRRWSVAISLSSSNTSNPCSNNAIRHAAPAQDRDGTRSRSNLGKAAREKKHMAEGHRGGTLP